MDKKYMIENKIKKIIKQNPRKFKLTKSNGEILFEPDYDTVIKLREHNLVSTYFWGIPINYDNTEAFKITYKQLKDLEKGMRLIN